MTKGKAKARRRAVRRTRHALNASVNFLTHASVRLLHKRSASHPVRSMVRDHDEPYLRLQVNRFGEDEWVRF